MPDQSTLPRSIQHVARKIFPQSLRRPRFAQALSDRNRVDADLNQVYGPRRVALSDLDTWVEKALTSQDAVVLEMTTNTWQVYDDLLPYVHSITVVHPPHVALITRAQVMTDRIAAAHLARLHAKGLLAGIWVPPQAVRDWRALVAQRSKMVRLAVQAKNRLHSTLHRLHIDLPAEGKPFSAAQRPWWENLPVAGIEKIRIASDLDTLDFSQRQIERLEEGLIDQAAQDERIPLLIQLPGVRLVAAVTILAAVGEITRFPQAKQLVGYAGLGARVHDSGQTTRTGRITKAGRRDLRFIMVEAAQRAAITHPHWKTELTRLEPRLGRNKAIVVIARKLLIAVWHVLMQQCADRFANTEKVARKMLEHAYSLGQKRRPKGQSAAEYARRQLDRLHLGQELTHISWGVKKPPVPLPPSSLSPDPS